MTWKSEAEVTREVKRYLDSLTCCWYFKVHGGPLQLAGVPDIVGVHRGRFFAIELKEENPNGRKSTRLQEKRMQDIRDAGGIAFLARSVSDVQAIIYDNVRGHIMPCE
jgi:hypothetical protein